MGWFSRHADLIGTVTQGVRVSSRCGYMQQKYTWKRGIVNILGKL
jgi:hypothetical protein